jgi:predicted DNA-binding transcriptional regulator YafY
MDKVTIHPQGQMLMPPKLDIASLEVVYEALFTEKIFEADYKSRGKKKPTKMEIHPHGLVIISPMIYLVGTIWDFTDMRHLALNRLSNATITTKPINKRKDFSLPEHVKKGSFGILYQEKPIKLKALFNKFAAEHLYDTPLSKDQVITDHSEHLMQLTASVPMTEQLKWWLLGFGDNVEVLAPKALRTEIAGIAKRLCEKYLVN